MTKNLIILFLIFASFRGTSQDLIESVPMQFIENYIFIEVTVNDNEKPLNFLFDTGAGITVVDTNIAKQLSLDINKESKISTSGKSLLSKESTSNSVKIGKNINLDSINLILMDLSHLSKYLNTNVDGVIGYDLLNKFILETHIDNKVFRFYEFDTFIYKGNSKPIELTTLESNLFGILINVIPNNRREPILLNFEIDTGADNYLSFHNKIVDKYQLVDVNKKQKLRKGFGADSTITTNISSKVKFVEFGGEKWKNISVMFEVDPINKRENSLADGLIGQRLLLDFNIIYNLKKRLVYLEKRK
uniref:retropepsin-like aspartic protease n=1 Tax=Gelidibacter sp. TaxID=2018083 RepID=UPI00404A19D2